MISFHTRYRRFFVFVLSVILSAGVFNSCSKEPITVTYVFGLIMESTGPGKETDPEMNDIYMTLLRELDSDLTRVIPDAGMRKVVSVELTPGDLRSEDGRKKDEYNSYLPLLKEIEASYRKRIEGIEKREGISFCFNCHYVLVRGGDNSETVCLQEYHFELKYN